MISSTASRPLPIASSHGRTDRILASGIVLAAALPFLVEIASVTRHYWYASGDDALELLRVRDVATRHTPTVGAWSRWGWAHPGPLLFYVLAPWVRLFGDHGMLIGMAVVNLASVLAVVLVAQRIGGTAGATLAAGIIALLVHGLGPSLLIDPWNPWAAFLPFVAFLAFVWGATCGKPLCLIGVVLTGSFVVQTHLGYAPVVVVLAVIATIVAARSGLTARTALIAAGCLVICWVPPIVQELWGTRANLSHILSYVRHPAGGTDGMSAALGTFGTQLRPYGAWVSNRETVTSGLERAASVAPAVATTLVVAVGGYVALRRRARSSYTLAALALVAIVTGIAATARTTGLLVPYVVRWWRGIAAISALSIVWSLAFAVPSRLVRRLVVALAGATLVVTSAASVVAARTPLPNAEISRAIRGVAPSTATALRRDHAYLLESVDSASDGASGVGLYAELSRRGFSVYTDPGPVADFQYGNWRVAPLSGVDGVIFMAAALDVAAGWHPPDGSKVIAAWDPLTPALRARANQLETDIRVSLGAKAPKPLYLGRAEDRHAAVLEGANAAEVDELGRLQLRGLNYRVYLAPA